MSRGLALATTAIVGSLSACYIAAAIFSKRLRTRCGVVSSLYQRFRIRYLLRCDPSSLLIIADFDRTITSAACGTSCHGVVEQCAGLSADYKAQTAALFEHYFPIETDPTVPRAAKVPLMQEWYTRAHKLLLKEPLTTALLDESVRSSPIALRTGAAELFAWCLAASVPLVVMSAGLGNVILSVLRERLPRATASALVGNATAGGGEGAQESPLPIVSNWLRFDASGHVSGFSEPLLHMFNKNGGFVRAQLGACWPMLSEGRRTILLLGDGVGDAEMADGLDAAHVIKIGFLNERDEQRVAARLPSYEAAFDAVILGDRSFAWVLQQLL